MSLTAEFKYGDIVKYNGENARVVKADSWSMYITIEVNGKQILVNKNDLFGMNNNYFSNKDYFEKHISACDDEIKQNEKRIEDNKKIWSYAKTVITQCRKDIRTLLAKNDVQNANELQDYKDIKQYKELCYDKSSARRAQIRASAEIIGAANDTGSACTSKMGYINQQAIFGLV